MDWKTWTKISGVILFIIAIVGFAGNYYIKGPSLEIQNFPGPADLDTLDVSEDITFTFFLYNTGDRSAFVKNIVVNYDLTTAIEVNPQSDFAINAGDSQEVTVVLPTPNTGGEYSLSLDVFYNKKTISSETVPLIWGGIK